MMRTLSRLPRRLWFAAAAGVLVLALGWALVTRWVPAALAGRIRSEAAERHLVARWSRLWFRPPLGLSLQGLICSTSDGAAVIRAPSLALDLDAGSVLALAPRIARIDAEGVRLTPRSSAVADSDTLPPESPSASRR